MKKNVREIIDILNQQYPDALCALHYEKDYELMIAVRLSAQCTDARVNLVTPALFARYPSLEAFAEADVDEVGEYVHSCGFWRAKARDMVLCAQMLLREYGGKVPDTMEELKELATGKSVVNPNVMREGLVYRSLDGRDSFKNVSREYLLKHNQ